VKPGHFVLRGAALDDPGNDGAGVAATSIRSSTIYQGVTFARKNSSASLTISGEFWCLTPGYSLSRAFGR
jgi:hypothetical protein